MTNLAADLCIVSNLLMYFCLKGYQTAEEYSKVICPGRNRQSPLIQGDMPSGSSEFALICRWDTTLRRFFCELSIASQLKVEFRDFFYIGNLK